MLTGETTDTKYYKIHAPYWVLFKYADKNKMKMPLTWNDSEKEMGLIERLTSKVTLFKPPTFPEDDDEIEELGKVTFSHTFSHGNGNCIDDSVIAFSIR